MSNQNPLFQHQTLSQVKEFAKIKSETDLRLKVRDAFFPEYSVDLEDERIDFLVYHERSGFFTETFMWAESKDKPADVLEMFAQLLLTIKKKVDAGEMPPKYLGVFDREKIAFVEYYNALDIFHLNDFNWKERPSSVSKETVNKVAKYLKNIVEYKFESDVTEIVGFIKTNFALGKVGMSKAQINKNNFVAVYNKWVREVLPTIGLSDTLWKKLKKSGVGDCEFYLADLLSRDNKTIIEKLNIVLRETHYKSKVKIEGELDTLYRDIGFSDGGAAHAKFWARYERPPKQEYHKHIIERRELLVPQEIRERKGAYFTPQIWVEKSQEYLEKAFGENWQEEYYIWDCCAGTCNLLANLTDKYKIWASTIDQPDVDIVHEIIDRGALNLLRSHVFQFDFLNDDFSKLPKGLRDIINDPEKQKKLIIYMNPPYAEAARYGDQGNKSQVASIHKSSEKYKERLGRAVNEVFAQFFMQIYDTMPLAKLASFSTLKYINSQNFFKFRQHFKAKFMGGFMCHANTFDNVKGHFPIGFLIWDLKDKKSITSARVDAYENDRKMDYCWFLEKKVFHSVGNNKFIINWLRQFFDKEGERIGYLRFQGTDFQTNSHVFITDEPSENDIRQSKITSITRNNLLEMSIYFAVRHAFKHTWINHNDQFLFPNDNYRRDKGFQNNCLIFTLFHDKNRISSGDDFNHWIPFTASEVDAQDNFQSTFMSNFLEKRKTISKEAKAVFKAGKDLWKYYHNTIKYDDKALIDASLYEIREYFKGRDEKGRMKSKATDERFNELDAKLRSALKVLAEKIQPKVYEYGFLKR